MRHCLWVLVLGLASLTPRWGIAQDAAPAANPPAEAPPQVATLYIASDSTAAGNAGWGPHLQQYFDEAKLKIANRARGGLSSRTYVSSGAWDRLVAELQPGDFVIIQFGHNDISPSSNPQVSRHTLAGIGEETEEIVNQQTQQPEVVHTFGWYLRKMIADVRGKQAEPIVMSATTRNIWTDGKVERGVGETAKWAREVAVAEKIMFVDLNALVADDYERMGQEAAGKLFPRDHTHTSVDGAQLNAKWVATGLKALREQMLIQKMSAAGRSLDVVDPNKYVAMRTVTREQFPGGFLEWLNLPDVGDPSLPTVFIIGDSTGRTDRGTGYDHRAQYGWGDPIENYFDRSKVNVVNRAVGGTGALTFITSNYWDAILQRLKPGDVVIMQFGHNDNGARGAQPGVGDETREIAGRGGTSQMVHTFGWYIGKYIDDTRAKGATPVVCSLIPRNAWEEGQVRRPENTHRQWAQQAAAAKNAAYIDLYELIATRYDELGQEAVKPLFSDGTHTTWAGALVNADCVMAGLRALPENPVAKYEREPKVTQLAPAAN